MKVTLCASCALGRAGFADRLREALGGLAEVATVDCMSGCARPSTVAFRDAGKTAYLFGDVVEGDLPELVVFAGLYGASADGNFADARTIGGLRMKAIARIPG